ncbi:hypothetical protein ACFWTC_32260 [Streptomyces sp. NPDC058619]|uniref:hypothetical protein n=1 Tax=unclassified Streptomyces TaxID=2593676 RepID=UPI00365CF3E9
MRKAASLALSIAGISALNTGTAIAADTPAKELATVTTVAGSDVDLSTATVSHFGYDGSQTFSSPVMNADTPGAAEPSNWLPARLTSSVKTAAAPGGFVCTIWVGGVVADGLRDIKAGTHQTCTGSFRTQWTQAQFASEKGGWHRITNSIIGPRSSQQINDTTFSVGCKSNPKDGRQNYRLEGRGYAIATNGVQVRGDLHYGKASKWTCV